jgi:tetratricopeptide (TPR) repeat protein
MNTKLLVILLLGISIQSYAQTVSVKDTTFTTYPFSDPNPIPKCGANYPYFRYDTYATKPVARSWKMVILENKYLRVKIMPEIGGKIWSVYDKTSSHELFYDNDAIKFRDISLRGPWTSGGIEFNFGRIGHAPSCSFPVSYKTAKKTDGSASCYIGVLDMLTRTHWTIEISLPADKAWLEIHTFWHNGTETYQPYYSWMNAGVAASDDLKLIYPSAYSVGHDGSIDAFPINGGRNLANYNEQNYGEDKSFHPGGSQKGYFGVYWGNSGVGLMHLADRDQKLGRKFFSWAQSDQGNIWKELLTDGRSQYVEIQSGRLFNQNAPGSVHTPYKQILFTPYSTDEWTEYWFPFSHTGGAQAASLYGVLNIDKDNVIRLYSLQKLNGKLSALDTAGAVVASKAINLEPAHDLSWAIGSSIVPSKIVLDRGNAASKVTLWNSDTQITDRPNKAPEDYHWDTAPAQCIYGQYCTGMREFREAEVHADSALTIDKHYIPALNLKSMLLLRQGKFNDAYSYASKSLAIDEYDAQANYLSGLAAIALGKNYDALDRFELAAITSELRSAAYTQLSKLHFKMGNYEQSMIYAKRSLIGNAHNVSGLEMEYLNSVMAGKASVDIIKNIAKLDTLSHFVDFERFILGNLTADELASSIQEEFRYQNYLEAAIKYHQLGLDERAIRILDATPEDNVLVSLWKAYLKSDKSSISSAQRKDLDFVFPFRTESLVPLKWAIDNGGDWHCSYLLSMLESYLGNDSEAIKLVDNLSAPDYAPFYGYRAELTGSEQDIKKAISLDPQEWRYRKMLADCCLEKGRNEDAFSAIESFYKMHKDNFHIADVYVKTLIANKDYIGADKVLSSIVILPFEGQSESHQMYRDVKLHLAAAAADKGRYELALKRVEESRLWPHNLGVGKPYVTDTSEEEWLTAVILSKQHKSAEAEKYLSRLNDSDGHWHTLFTKATTSQDSITTLLDNR